VKNGRQDGRSAGQSASPRPASPSLSHFSSPSPRHNENKYVRSYCVAPYGLFKPAGATDGFLLRKTLRQCRRKTMARDNGIYLPAEPTAVFNGEQALLTSGVFHLFGHCFYSVLLVGLYHSNAVMG